MLFNREIKYQYQSYLVAYHCLNVFVIGSVSDFIVNLLQDMAASTSVVRKGIKPNGRIGCTDVFRTQSPACLHSLASKTENSRALQVGVVHGYETADYCSACWLEMPFIDKIENCCSWPS